VSQTLQVIGTVPAPTDAVGVVVTADGNTIYALEPSGRVAQIDGSSGQLVSAFPTGGPAHALALSPDGATLYVLKGQVAENTAVVNTDTESVTKVLPAPANAVALAVGPDNSTLYTLVGSSSIGNIQAFAVGSS